MPRLTKRSRVANAAKQQNRHYITPANAIVDAYHALSEGVPCFTDWTTGVFFTRTPEGPGYLYYHGKLRNRKWCLSALINEDGENDPFLLTLAITTTGSLDNDEDEDEAEALQDATVRHIPLRVKRRYTDKGQNMMRAPVQEGAELAEAIFSAIHNYLDKLPQEQHELLYLPKHRGNGGAMTIIDKAPATRRRGPAKRKSSGKR